MPEYCTCGAELPPDARFCHKCGKPQRDEPLIEEPAAPAPPPPPVTAVLTPVNFGNALAVRLGFMTALMANVLTLFPLLSLACPLWLFGAGVLAAVWYRQRSLQPLTTENGMRMGWITGVFSFMILTVLYTFAYLARVRSGVHERETRELLESLPFTRGNVDGFLEMMRNPTVMIANLVVSLLVMFVVVTAFAVMGGAAGAKIAARRRS